MQTDLACNYKPIPGMIKHNGDETEVEDKGKIMKMPGLWRILKDCKVVEGGDRAGPKGRKKVRLAPTAQTEAKAMRERKQRKCK